MGPLVAKRIEEARFQMCPVYQMIRLEFQVGQHPPSKKNSMKYGRGKVYKDEDEAQKDIQDAATDTNESDIQRDVNIIVPELSLDGETD